MRNLLVKLALLGFLCRALVPAGFMPAPLADGGPIRFCHGGPAGALLTALIEQRSPETSAEHAHSSHEEHHDHTRDDASHEGWDRCPVGTAFAFAFLTADVALPLLPLEHGLEPDRFDRVFLPVIPAHYQPRAPPLA